jgi:hypothetical protein
MTYFDSTITCGYYDAFQVQNIDHTYALIDHQGELYAFPCYGQVARHEGEFGIKNVKYPVDLWTPYMLGSQNVGSSLPANLFVALGMAQFTRTPAYNHRLSDWIEYWKKMPDGAACWGGIVYGVSGVCQQVCNRVLWSTREKDFTYCPVNWPPSFSASYWVYGYYGKITEPVAELLARQLVEIARTASAPPILQMDRIAAMSVVVPPRLPDVASPPVAASTGVSLDPELRTALGKELRKELGGGVKKEERRGDVEQLLSRAPGGAAVTGSSLTLSGVLHPDEKFAALKSELDKQLLRGEIRHQEYADQVNQGFARMLEEFRNVLPAETFASLFPDSSAHNIVQRDQMPVSYEVFQKAAAI